MVRSLSSTAFLIALLAAFSIAAGVSTLDKYLLEMAFADNLEKVKSALAKGANINVRRQGSGQTPLMGSVLRGNTEMVRFLLQQGADTTIGEKDGYTPPHGAGFQGRADVMKLLHESGVDVTVFHEEDGYAPFHRACWGDEARHADTVEYLLQEGLAVVHMTGMNDARTCMAMTSNPATIQVLQKYAAKQTGGEL